jgi:hypothetical protein
MTTTLSTKYFSPHLFWSYRDAVELPISVIVKQVVGYGEIEDLQMLCSKIPGNELKKIINTHDINAKRVNFLEKIILSDDRG